MFTKRIIKKQAEMNFAGILRNNFHKLQEGEEIEVYPLFYLGQPILHVYKKNETDEAKAYTTSPVTSVTMGKTSVWIMTKNSEIMVKLNPEEMKKAQKFAKAYYKLMLKSAKKLA